MKGVVSCKVMKKLIAVTHSNNGFKQSSRNQSVFYYLCTSLCIKEHLSIDYFSATFTESALYQLASLGTTLGIAIIGGIITGFILNIPLWEQLENEEYFEDGKYWELEVYQVPHDEDDH